MGESRPPRRTVYVLAVEDGPDGPEARGLHRIDRAETVVGRGPAADLRLDDPEVSVRHCMIRIEGPCCEVVDLESPNGICLNGRPQKPGTAIPLRHLDDVKIGSTRLVLLAGTHVNLPRPA